MRSGFGGSGGGGSPSIVEVAPSLPYTVATLPDVDTSVSDTPLVINVARAVAMPPDGAITATGLPSGVAPADGIVTLSRAAALATRLVTILYAWGGRSVQLAFNLIVRAVQAWAHTVSGSTLSVTASPAAPAVPQGAVSGTTLSITG